MKKLFVLILAVGVYLLVQKLQQERAEFSGLTVSEATDRLTAKLEPKLAGRVEPDKVATIIESVIAAMRTKGIIVADPA